MIYKARYVLPVSSDHIDDGAVLVKDDRIADIGRASDVIARHPDEEVDDLGLAAIMPGFIDCHTHLDHSVLRGLIEDSAYASWKYHMMLAEKRLDASDWELSSLLGAHEAAQAGITTVADITPNKCTVDALAKTGLRAIIYRALGPDPCMSSVQFHFDPEFVRFEDEANIYLECGSFVVPGTITLSSSA